MVASSMTAVCSVPKTDALLVLVPAECTDTDLETPLGKVEPCLEALGVVLVEEVGEVPLGVRSPVGGLGKEL